MYAGVHTNNTIQPHSAVEVRTAVTTSSVDDDENHDDADLCFTKIGLNARETHMTPNITKKKAAVLRVLPTNNHRNDESSI